MSSRRIVRRNFSSGRPEGGRELRNETRNTTGAAQKSNRRKKAAAVSPERLREVLRFALDALAQPGLSKQQKLRMSAVVLAATTALQSNFGVASADFGPL